MISTNIWVEELSRCKTEVMWFGTAAGRHKLPAGSGRIYAGVEIRDCNPGIPDLFINPEIPGLGGPNPGISGLKIY